MDHDVVSGIICSAEGDAVGAAAKPGCIAVGATSGYDRRRMHSETELEPPPAAVAAAATSHLADAAAVEGMSQENDIRAEARR